MPYTDRGAAPMLLLSRWIYASLFEKANIDLMLYSSTLDVLLGPPTTEVSAAFALRCGNCMFAHGPPQAGTGTWDWGRGTGDG